MLQIIDLCVTNEWFTAYKAIVCVKAHPQPVPKGRKAHPQPFPKGREL